MNKKRIMLSILIAVICLGLVGVTYAAFTYSRIGTTNSKQIVGDIYMHYRESNTLTLENAMPSNTYDSTKYFEFTIDGKNTYTKKDIYYEIDLTHGSDPNIEGRTIRLADKFLKFRLVEVVNNEEVEIFTNKSYNDLTNKRIHVETIPKNTTSEITKTYRIYMWIDNNLKIGNDNADYSVSDWNKIYASIKVNVAGDFEDKYTTTPPYCFTTSDNGDGTVTITGLNNKTIYEINPDVTEEELQVCVNKNLMSGSIGPSCDIECATNYCRGIGNHPYGGTLISNIRNYGNSFPGTDIELYLENNIIKIVNNPPSECQNLTEISIPRLFDGKNATTIGENAFSGNQLTSVIIPNSVTTIGDGAFYNNKLTSVEIPNSVTTIEFGAFAENQLTSVEIPNSVTTIDSWAFSGNQLTSIEIPNSVTTIGERAFDGNQLTSVIIPNSVTTIGARAFYGNQLTSVSISNSVTIIGDYAFQYNQLTSVSIPNSVTTIGTSAFAWNQLTSVSIGNGITSIGSIAFIKSNSTDIIGEKTYYNNPNLSSITINKSCSDIKNNLKFNNTNYYPWLSASSPYTGIGGVTIYGSNNEVCDTF